MSLEQLFRGRFVDTSDIAKRLKRVAEELGLPLTHSSMIYNTRLAQEMAKWAESKGKGNEIHQALFKTYFVDSINIGHVDELTKLALSIGLSGDEARQVVESRAYKDAVDSDWNQSRAMEINGVPTFIMGDRRLVGFQPYEALEQFVSTERVVRRSGN
jgi:predicted DsbA family dithiol-disulfide isomerase